jgi:hypothetical protein
MKVMSNEDDIMGMTPSTKRALKYENIRTTIYKTDLK